MPISITIVQFEPIRKDIHANIKTLQNLLKNITTDVIVLPELANSGYLYPTREELRPFAEKKDGSGRFLHSLMELANAANALIITGYAESAGKNLFNAAAAISPDGVIQNYRKTHLYADEKELFSPGDTGFQTFEWHDTKIGMMICFDWFFPESARTLALQGAQIIAHPANLVMPYCQNAMVTRALENHVFTVTANRTGKESLGENQLQFTGASQITDPKGRVLFRADHESLLVHTETIAPEKANDKHISHRNHIFDDRRPDMYNRV